MVCGKQGIKKMTPIGVAVDDLCRKANRIFLSIIKIDW